MKKNLFIFILSIWQNFVVAQVNVTPVVGKVTLQNSKIKTGKKAPVIGAQVSCGVIATNTSTDQNGVFTLRFALDNIPENKVEVMIKVVGTNLVVVNNDCRFVQLRSGKDNADSISIYMCREGEWEMWAKKYYDINDSIIAREFSVKIAKLQQQNKDSLTKLLGEKNRLLNIVREYANLFAMTNLDDASELFNSAFTYFRKGDILKAIEILDDNKLRENFIKAQQAYQEGEALIKIGSKKKNIANEAIIKCSDDYLFKARLLVSQLRFEEANEKYNLALKIYPQNLAHHIEYAHFLLSQYQYDSALEQYNKCLVLSATKSDSAMISTEIGLCFFSLKDRGQSKRHFTRSLQFYRDLAQVDSTTYNPMLANSYYYLSLSSLLNEDIGLFYAYIDSAEKIYSRLAQFNEIYYIDLASIVSQKQNIESLLSNLSNDKVRSQVLNMFNVILGDEAFKYYDKFITLAKKYFYNELPDSIGNKIWSHNTNSFQINGSSINQLKVIYALSLQGYGNAIVQYVNNKNSLPAFVVIEGTDTSYSYFRASKLLESSLNIWDTLAKEAPELSFDPYKASALFTLGTLYYLNGDTVTALSNFSQSIEKYEQLAQKEPRVYLPNLMTIISVVAGYYSQLGQSDSVIQMCNKIRRNILAYKINDSSLYGSLVLVIGSQLNKLYLDCFYQHTNALTKYRDTAIANAEMVHTYAVANREKISKAQMDDAKWYVKKFTNITSDSISRDTRMFQIYLKAKNTKKVGDSLIRARSSDSTYFSAINYYQTLIDSGFYRGQAYYDQAEIYSSLAYNTPNNSNKLTNQRKSVEKLETLFSLDTSSHVFKSKLAREKGNLAYYYIVNENNKAAISEAEGALKLDSTADWIYTNLALAYWLNSNFSVGEKIYVKYRDKTRWDKSEKYSVSFLRDLNSIKQLNIYIPKEKKLRKILK